MCSTLQTLVCFWSFLIVSFIASCNSLLGWQTFGRSDSQRVPELGKKFGAGNVREKEIQSLWTLKSSLLGEAGESFEIHRARVAVDYGPRLIGLASSLGRTTRTNGVIKNNGNLTFAAQQIIDFARRSGAIEILIGLPLDSNGKMSYGVRNFNGNLCLNFSSVLASVAAREMPRTIVKLVDERYTTREAKARIKVDELPDQLDAMSARCLLDRYIEDEGANPSPNPSSCPCPCSNPNPNPNPNQGAGALEARACAFPVPQALERFDYGLVKRHIEDLYHREPSELEKKKRYIQLKKEGRDERGR